MPPKYPYQLMQNTRSRTERPYAFYLDLVYRYKSSTDGFRIAQSDAHKVARFLHDKHSSDVKTAINYYKAIGTPILEVYSP